MPMRYGAHDGQYILRSEARQNIAQADLVGETRRDSNHPMASSLKFRQTPKNHKKYPAFVVHMGGAGPARIKGAHGGGGRSPFPRSFRLRPPKQPPRRRSYMYLHAMALHARSRRSRGLERLAGWVAVCLHHFFKIWICSCSLYLSSFLAPNSGRTNDGLLDEVLSGITHLGFQDPPLPPSSPESKCAL